MAVPVARVHLKVAHAALPALLPTPPVWKKLPPLLPSPCSAAILPVPAKPLLAKPSRADADERWDAHKTKPGSSTESSASSSRPRSAVSIKSSAGRGCWRKNTTLPAPKPGRADSVERWDAHKNKKAASPASSSSSSGTSSVVSSKSFVSRASSDERWEAHKKLRPAQAKVLDDGESSTGSNGMDTEEEEEEEEEEEIVWKPRAMYAGPGFAAAVPEPSRLPMPTAFMVPAA